MVKTICDCCGKTLEENWKSINVLEYYQVERVPTMASDCIQLCRGCMKQALYHIGVELPKPVAEEEAKKELVCTYNE